MYTINTTPNKFRTIDAKHHLADVHNWVSWALKRAALPTYSERLWDAQDNCKGVNLYTLYVWTARYGDRRLSFETEAEACEMAKQYILPALRARFGEDNDPGSYNAWSVRIYCLITSHPKTCRDHDTNWRSWSVDNRGAYVWAWASGRERCSHPLAAVFAHTFGRDCDGYSVSNVIEARDLLDMHRKLDEAYSWADGPMNHRLISRYDYETINLRDGD